MVQSIDQHKSQMIAAKKRFHRWASILLFLFLLTPSNVAALVDSDGAIQEGYKYRAHGTVTVLTTDGNDDTWFTADDDTSLTRPPVAGFHPTDDKQATIPNPSSAGRVNAST